MALTFPDSPNIGDLYTAENGVVYEWNGTAWDVEVAGTQYWTGDSSNISYLGNVGIGTTNVDQRLCMLTSLGDCLIKMQAPIGSVSGFNAIGSNTLAFQTGFEEKMRLDDSGRLLVGTSTSTNNIAFNQKLAVVSTGNNIGGASLTSYGGTTNYNSTILYLKRSRGTSDGSMTAVANDDIVGSIIFQGSNDSTFLDCASIVSAIDGPVSGGGANDMPGRLVFSTTRDGASSPTIALTINRNGELFSVPTYTAVTTNAANVFIASNGNMSRSSSSRKYKTNIENLEDQYADRILDCRPVWYRSTAVKDNPDHGYWGFIAEEVAEIDPRLVHWKTIEVTYDENGSSVETSCDPEPEGVQYERFVPHLLNLIKRQQQAIETLQTEVAALKQV